MARPNSTELASVLKTLEAEDHVESLAAAVATALSALPRDAKTQAAFKRLLSDLADLSCKRKGAIVSAAELRASLAPRSFRSPKPTRSPSASPRISQFLRNSKSSSSFHKLTMSYSKLKKKRREDSFTEKYDPKPTLVSTFNHLHGSVAFSKAKRTFEFYKPVSPGPAAYLPKNAIVKPKSPGHSIPRGGERFAFARDCSPGPQAYYPSAHFVSH